MAAAVARRASRILTPSIDPEQSTMITSDSGGPRSHGLETPDRSATRRHRDDGVDLLLPLGEVLIAVALQIKLAHR